MSDYSYTDIMKMQDDAIKRVEEMQKKARATAGLDNKKNAPAPGGAASQMRTEQKRVPMPDNYLASLKQFAAKSADKTAKPNGKTGGNTEASAPKAGIFADGIKNILGDLNLDSDKALILSLILLLSEENADETLLLALIYMLT